MTELNKTLCFAAIAGVLLVVAVFTRPSPPGVDPDEEINQPLFKDLKDPLSITSLEILKPNEEIGKLSGFKVSRIGSEWLITTQENYPANAKAKLREITLAVMGLKILGVVTDNTSEHKTYGVLEPDPKKESVLPGAGTLVILGNQNGEEQARLIVGKKAGENQYYVRRSKESRVYTVAVEGDKLSTKFSDWIEADLLELNPYDVRELVLTDSVVLKRKEKIKPRRGGIAIPLDALTKELPTGELFALSRLAERDKSVLTFTLEGGKWKLTEMLLGNDKKPGSLTADEEPNQKALDDLKQALDNLEVVGVRRKPEGLDLDRSTGQLFVENVSRARYRDIRTSLAFLGYWLPRNPEVSFWTGTAPVLDIAPDSGKLAVRQSTGVEYRLLFGDVAEDQDVSKATEINKDKKTAGEGALDHYVMISVHFNEKAFEANDKKAHPGDKPDAREKRKKEALKTVRKLNSRFANWLYVVNDEVFKKIRLTKDEVIKNKESTLPPMPSHP